MELHLGEMRNKELAEWFGIKEKSYANSRPAKLKELEFYAEFDIIRGGVNITKILDENNKIYIKDSQHNYEVVRDNFDKEWNENGIDTCSNVALKIYNNHSDKLSITQGTTYKYTLKARNELYEKPFSVARGKLGNCVYIWCKVVEENRDDDIICLAEFTEEEKAIKEELMKKYFASSTEKEVMVAEMVNRGEIDKAEAYDLLCEIKNLNKGGFMAFMKELQEKIGSRVLRGTQLIKDGGNAIEFERLESGN